MRSGLHPAKLWGSGCPTPVHSVQKAGHWAKEDCPQVLGFSLVFPLGFRLPLDLLLFLSFFLFFFLQWGWLSSSWPIIVFWKDTTYSISQVQFALGWVIPWVSPISDLDAIWMRLWTLDFWVDAGPIKALGTIDIEWIYFAWKKNLSLGEWGWTTMVWMFVFSCFNPQGNGNKRWVLWEINKSLRGPSW